MKSRDLLWLLGFPIYLIVGTFRHEGAHALVALMQGAEITEFVVLPGFREGRLYFGYILLEGGNLTWLMTAAPYFLDMLTFAIFFAVCGFVGFKRHWLWLNLVIVGMISPLVNSGYQYFKVGMAMYGDIGELLVALTPGWVHAYMLVTIGLYVAGLWFTFTRSRHIQERRLSGQQAGKAVP